MTFRIHTKPKHCFDDVKTHPSLLLTSDITAVNNYMLLISLDPAKMVINDLKMKNWHPDMTNHRPLEELTKFLGLT